MYHCRNVRFRRVSGILCNLLSVNITILLAKKLKTRKHLRNKRVTNMSPQHNILILLKAHMAQFFSNKLSIN